MNVNIAIVRDVATVLKALLEKDNKDRPSVDVHSIMEIMEVLLDNLRHDSYQKGLAAGYANAIQAIEWERDGDAESSEPTPETSTPEPAPEPEVPTPASAPQRDLPPYQQHALSYVREHPGTTAHKSGLKNKAALYTLVELGLVEKRGAQFFPAEQATGPT